MAASSATRRVQKELAELMATPPDHVTVVPNEGNMAIWEVTIEGPPKPSPYSGGKFKLGVEFGLDYPFKAPQIKFKTKMYHPNIDSDGSICMGMLKTDQWKPSTKMQHVFFALYDLIETPNPDDPLVSSIAEQYRQDRRSFDHRAAEYTRQARSSLLELRVIADTGSVCLLVPTASMWTFAILGSDRGGDVCTGVSLPRPLLYDGAFGARDRIACLNASRNLSTG